MDDKKFYELRDKFREEGRYVWSISRLNTYDRCPFEFRRTYVDDDCSRGEDNIYSIAGTLMHDALEDMHKNNNLNALNRFFDKFQLTKEIQELSFPYPAIETKWMGDMEHFVRRFTRLDKHIETEKLFLYEILPDIWIQGYVDGVYKNDDGTYTVFDWKSSSKFTGEKLLENGRQLVLYKMALEKLFGLEVSKTEWFMVKYVRVNHGGYSRMCNRSTWVKETATAIHNYALDYLNNDVGLCNALLDQCVKNNNLNAMPIEVQNRFQLEDCTVEYKVTEELEQELLDYIERVVSKFKKDKEFKALKINDSNEFFCKHLCGHRNECPALQEYESDKNKKK